jgi:hypothetical protein
LTSDEGLLLPEERLGLAELCIRFSGEPTAVPALVKYMCREYVRDRARYRDIRDKVARRMGDAQCDGAAEAIWEACRSHIWTQLADFQNLPASAKPETEGGLIELLGDAFAATPDSGLRVLKASKNQWVSGINRLPIFRRFAVKSGRQNADVRSWLMDEGSRSSGDKTLQLVVEALSEQKKVNRDDPGSLLREYLKHGDLALYNQLRFLKDEYLFKCLGTHLSGPCSNNDIELILKLLRGFQSRNRVQVVEVLLQNWQQLAVHDYGAAADILGAYPIASVQRDAAIYIFNGDLGGVHHVAARKALEQLLNRGS